MKFDTPTCLISIIICGLARFSVALKSACPVRTNIATRAPLFSTTVITTKKAMTTTRNSAVLTTRVPSRTTTRDAVIPTIKPPSPPPSSNDRPSFSWPSGKRLTIYHTNWACYQRKFNVKDLAIDYISDINYAFFDLIRDPTTGYYLPESNDPWADFQKRYTTAEEGVLPLDPSSGGTGPFGNFGQFIKLKNAGKKFNFGISIGGWSSSKYFSVAMRTTLTRTAFINRMMEWVELYPKLIDRIDIDWEYISAPGTNYGLNGNIVNENDAKNFGQFLKDMRKTLDAAGYKNIELTACTTAEPANVAALPIAEMILYLDTINIMTYDFKSSEWGPTISGHHSNLVATTYAVNSVQKAVKAFTDAGVPTNKLLIGVPFYTRGFANTNGLGQAANGLVASKSFDDAMSDYKDLPWNGATEFYDEQAKAAYTYDPVKRELLSYDSVASIKEKLRYLWDMDIKGVIVWESSGDVSITSPRSLTKALYDGLQKRP